MLPGDRDTICALASARGRSGLAVVRVSGPAALTLVWSRFRPRRPLDQPPPRVMVLGDMLDDDGHVLDDALLVLFPAGFSYTGETVVELHLHGSPVIVDAVLGLLIADGARLAEPGEFTRRAFVAGRLDLSQAEAVADVIEAKSLAAVRAAHRRLAGALSDRIAHLRERLIEAMALAEAELDFPDEDLGEIDLTRLRGAVAEARAGVDELLAGHARARALAAGAQVALAGRPNAGKSSLLNRLAGTRRALVHEEAGTTRDLVEAEVTLDGVPVRLVDTAGLRHAVHEVERAGVELAHETIAGADLTVYLIDGVRGVTDEDRDLIAALPEGRFVVVWNKNDLAAPDTTFAQWGDLAVSAKHGDGIDALTRRVVDLLGAHDDGAELLLATLRHRGLAEDAARHLGQIDALLADSGALELVAIELRDTAAALGEIVGETSVEHVLDAIFSKFCVGK